MSGKISTYTNSDINLPDVDKTRKKKRTRAEHEHRSTILQIILSVVFFAVGVFASFFIIRTCMSCYDQIPILLEQPDEVTDKIVSMMDAICEGDYELASESILGNPDFGVDRQPESAIGMLLWDAYLNSLSYELVGACHVTESGIAQDLTISYLELSSVTASLEQRAKDSLEQLILSADDVSEIYNENNEYREEIVMEILYNVTLDALQEDATVKTVRITVNLVFEDGSWWVVPQKELLEAVSCGVLS